MPRVDWGQVHILTCSSHLGTKRTLLLAKIASYRCVRTFNHARNGRHAMTGSGFLQSTEFLDWLQHDGSSTIWCYGSSKYPREQSAPYLSYAGAGFSNLVWL